MQVKKFEAPTIQEALENVKRELGPEAIILQTKKNKRGFGLLSKASVEITAAISERSLQKKQHVEERMPEPNQQAMRKLSAEKQANILDKYMDRHLQQNLNQVQEKVEVRQHSPQNSNDPKPASGSRKITATRYADILDDAPASDRPAVNGGYNPPPSKPVKAAEPPEKTKLEEELKNLKKQIEELKETKSVSAASESLLSADIPALQDAFDQLVLNGVDRRIAWSLIKKVTFELGPERSKNPELVFDTMAHELMLSVEVFSPIAELSSRRGESSGTPSVIAVLGPSGSGKSTTLAKIAGEAALKKGLRVGLIHIGSDGISFDQAGTYAKILNIPFRTTSSVEDLRAALSDFNSLDLVLMDTSGISYRDPKGMKDIHSILKEVPSLKSYLVLSATTRDVDLYDIVNRYHLFRPHGLIFSKLDEAMIHGTIYNVSQKTKLPLIYFTTGRRIPDDIEEATPERVAAILLEI